MEKLSISTIWNHKPGTNLRKMLSEIKELGLNTIELSYTFTNEHMEEIIPLMDEMQMKVSDIHNFCPIPYDEPCVRHVSNYYRLSALDEEERLRAVKWTQRTIDTACRVHAKAVIIHAGTVERECDLSGELIYMYKEGKGSTDEFVTLREKILKDRRDKRPPFMASVVKSLKDVMAYAQKKGIVIGLENRYYPAEIPDYEEIGELLDLFHEQGLFYWHDVGHAEANERLGMTSHLDYLKRYQDRLIGFHIHGVERLNDHLAPFEGDFKLTKVLPFIQPHHLRVIESHGKATRQQIQEAVRRLS